MKLCRYGKAGYEKPGLVDDDGRVRDLSKIIEQIGPNELSPRGLKMLAKVKPDSLPLVNGSPRMGVPYVGIGKFVAIGLNYSDHAKEAQTFLDDVISGPCAQIMKTAGFTAAPS